MAQGGLADLDQEWGNLFKTQDSIHLHGLDRGTGHGRGFCRGGILRDDDAAKCFDPGRPARAIVIGAGEDDAEQPLAVGLRSEEHTSELQSRLHLVCRLLLEKKKTPSRNSAPRSTIKPLKRK